MRKFYSYILICVLLVTGILPAAADYLGPNPDARYYLVDTTETFHSDGVYVLCKSADSGTLGQYCNASLDGLPDTATRPTVTSCASFSGTVTEEPTNQDCEWNISYGTKTPVIADDATASHVITCTGVSGVNSWCNNDETITIRGVEPKPGANISGAEMTDGEDTQTARSLVQPYVFTYRKEGYTPVNYWTLSTVGDTSEMMDAEFRIDKSAPEASCIIDSTPAYEDWYIGSVVITGTSVDSVSDIQKQEFTAGSKSGQNSITLTETCSDLPVSLTATDYATNTNTIECTRINLDNTKPVFDNYTNVTSNQAFGPVVNFTVSAHDEHSGLEYAAVVIDGEEYPAENDGIELETGNHSLVYKAVDNVGNINTTSPVTFYVDATAPETAITAPVMNGQEGLVTYGSVISGTASDIGGGFGKVFVEYPGSNGFVEASFTSQNKQLRSETGKWSVTLPVTGLTSGYATIKVKAVDVFENESDVTDVAEVLVDVDAPKPDYEANGTQGDEEWYRGAVLLEGTSTDDHSGVMTETVAYNCGGVSNSAANSVSIPGTTSGICDVTVTVKDFANIEKSSSYNGAIKIDNTAPVIESKTEFVNNDPVSYKQSFALTTSDEHSGVRESVIIIDGEEYSSAGTSADQSMEFETGFHTVQYKTVDKAGNETLSDTYRFFADADAPESEIDEIVMNGKQGLVTHGSVITGTTSDLGGGFGKVYVEYPGSNGFIEAEYTRGTKATTYETGTWSVTLPSEGLTSGYTTFSVKAEDIFNNMSEPIEVEILIDVDDPTPSYEIEGFNDFDGKWYTGSVTIKGTSTDEHSGVMEEIVGYAENGETSHSDEGSITVPETVSGILPVTVSVKDFAENEASKTWEEGLFIDNKNPELGPVTETDIDHPIAGNITLEMAASDEHSGIQYVAIIVDGEEHVSNSEEFSYDAAFTTTGVHTIRYKAVDNVNLETLSDIYEVYVDVTPPTVTFSDHSLNGVENLLNELSNIEGSSEDEGTGIKKTLIRLPWNEEWLDAETVSSSDLSTESVKRYLDSWKLALTAGGDPVSGEAAISAKAVDKVDNESEIVTINVLVDIDNPEPDFELEGTSVESDAKTWYVGKVTVNGASTDEHSGIMKETVKISCGSEMNITGDAPVVIEDGFTGVCAINLFAYDYADHMAEIEDEAAVYIDNTAPTMSDFTTKDADSFFPGKSSSAICINDAADEYVGLSKAYLLSGGEVRASVSVSKNGKVCIPYSLEDGIHQISFRLEDKLGNETISDEMEITIDDYGPVLQFTSAPSIYRPSEKTISFRGIAKDDPSGVQELRFSTDGGETWNNVDVDEEGNFSLSVTPKKMMTVIVEAIDSVGNISAIETVPLKQVSDQSARINLPNAVMANMIFKPSIIDKEGNVSYDFSGVKSMRAFVYGRGFDHAEIKMSPDNGYAVMWDGIFPTNVTAPEGWYWLTIEVTDVVGNIDCYNYRIWAPSTDNAPKPVETNEPAYKAFDISGIVDSFDKVSVTVNGVRYMLADFSQVASDITVGSKVSGKGRAYTKENVLVAETLTKLSETTMPFNGLVDDLGDDYVIIDGHALVLDKTTQFYCVDTRVGDYVSGLYTVDAQNRMHVTEFGPLSCERDVITRTDTGIVK